MNRRAFLTGLIASTTLAINTTAVEIVLAAAPEIDWKTYFEQWVKDAMAVHIRCWEDQIIYGVAAWRNTETYPYIERVDPAELPAPDRIGGLFDR